MDIEAEINEVVEAGREPPEESRGRLLVPDNVVSTGSTMVNIACSGLAEGGLLKGKYYIFVGASQAGKTWMYHAVFAESTLHPRFKDYRLIKDEPEHGSDFDVARYFGKRTAERLEPAWPGRTDEYGNPMEASRTVEEFYDNVDRNLAECEKNRTGMIYVLDSMDALSSERSQEITEEAMEARSKGREVKGNYGDGKAKVNSQRLRDVVNRLERSGSILIIICQERDNIGAMTGGKTFSGGNALLFYACLQLWFKKIGPIEAQVKGKKRALGTLTKCQIIKNRLTGRQNKDVNVSYYYAFGIDDIGDMVDYLLDEGHWSGGKTSVSKIDAVELGLELPKEHLVKKVESDPELYRRLRDAVWATWRGIQDAMEAKVSRRNKYADEA